MALTNLFAWSQKNEKTSTACGTACGAGDKPEGKQPAACGTACGAGDKPGK